MTTMHPSAHANVNDMVGKANGIFIVFHHNHGVAKVAQASERLQQTVIVALVQANGWLIKYIHHAHQACPNLTGKADALGFTP